MNIKQILKSIIPASFVSKVRNIKNEVRMCMLGKKRIQTSAKFISIKDKKNHVFFGYYDISPFQDNSIIYLKTNNKKKASIMRNNLAGDNEKFIVDTHAWNWQQGCRLRWHPKIKNMIVFNDYINNSYICRFYNINTRKETIIHSPLYDLSHDGKYGLSIDFERLDFFRPAYGYSNRKYLNNINPKTDGIFLVDIETNTTKLIVSYQEIANSLGIDSKNLSNYYINHLSYSPNDDKFLFFWLFYNNGWHSASLLVYDFKTKHISVLENQLKVSHYTWMDNERILCTAMNDNPNDLSPKYNIYYCNGQNNDTLFPEVLKKDGHPSFLNETIIISDTYPNSSRYQDLFALDINTGRINVIASIYSKITPDLSMRTDLHPRIDKDNSLICIDCNPSKYRQLLIIDIKNIQNGFN